MQAMDGLIVINKPTGLSSSQVCHKVKKRLGVKKAGHLGTLDPLATGVLPLCINEGTKLVQFLMQGQKEYRATMRLGVETDTQDSLGAVVRTSCDLPCSSDRVSAVIQEFCGELLQTPPMYSALKRNGVPLYKLARRGEWVERPQRPITIYAIEALAIEVPDITFRVVCSHGTYVRTICYDIGRRLGCGAHMTALERTRNGTFHIRHAVSLEELETRDREELIRQYLIPAKDALQGVPELAVDDVVARKIRNGIQITVQDLGEAALPVLMDAQVLKVVSRRDDLISVVESQLDKNGSGALEGTEPVWKILRVFVDT
ncbi:MAG: tRNA pseudouridine(55) synthase TruB [Deltaproteobacteria bacterium]|nr:tRNA pseudouridine(55) synthase TruB [Deltaproteobacteria bacterium]